MRTLKELKQEVDRLSKELDRINPQPYPKVGQVWRDVDCGKYILSYTRGVGYFAAFEDGTTSKAYRDLDEVRESIIEDGNDFVSEHATIEKGDA